MGKSAFVTGATGFLGRNLVKELSYRGWEITALHRGTSSPEDFPGAPLKLRKGSIEDLESLMEAVPFGIDAIFHMAASTGFWSKHNQQQYKTNVIGTGNIIKAALEKKASRLIHTSSIAAYGFHDTAINEGTPSNALGTGINYFITKYLAEQEVKKAVHSGLDAVILNPAHIVGPYDTHNWIQVFNNVNRGQMPGIPDTSGSFVFAPEVAKAHVEAYENGNPGENYILGGVNATMLEFVNTIEQELGKSLSKKTNPIWLLKVVTLYYQAASIFSKKEPLLTPEKTKLLAHRLICNDSKARKELGFKAVPLSEMVASTCAWLKQENLLS